MYLLGLPQDTWPLRSHMPIWYVSLPGIDWHCLSVVWSSRVTPDPAWVEVQGFRCQSWLRVMLSHVKLPYPGRPQVRGVGIKRSPVGFQFILLIDIVWDRPLLYSYCFHYATALHQDVKPTDLSRNQAPEGGTNQAPDVWGFPASVAASL